MPQISHEHPLSKHTILNYSRFSSMTQPDENSEQPAGGRFSRSSPFCLPLSPDACCHTVPPCRFCEVIEQTLHTAVVRRNRPRCQASRHRSMPCVIRMKRQAVPSNRQTLTQIISACTPFLIMLWGCSRTSQNMHAALSMCLEVKKPHTDTANKHVQILPDRLCDNFGVPTYALQQHGVPKIHDLTRLQDRSACRGLHMNIHFQNTHF